MPSGLAGSFLFGKITMADAMYAPVVSRFRTYGVKLDGELKTLRRRAHLGSAGDAAEWREAALAEKEEIEELEAEDFRAGLRDAEGGAVLEFQGRATGKASHRLEVVEIHGVADVLARWLSETAGSPRPGSCPC